MNTALGDLVLLVADKDMKFAIEGLLSRPLKLGIRPLSFLVKVHTEGHDAGCYRRSHELMRPFIKEYDHCLVLFDREFDFRMKGSKRDTVENLETKVSSDLAKNGWQDRGQAIVIDPELEQWVWSDCPELGPCLGWTNTADLRAWLHGRQLWLKSEVKPKVPKETFRKALRESRKPLSSAIFGELARVVNVEGCVDPSFQKLVRVLRQWFPKSHD